MKAWHCSFYLDIYRGHLKTTRYVQNALLLTNKGVSDFDSALGHSCGHEIVLSVSLESKGGFHKPAHMSRGCKFHTNPLKMKFKLLYLT